MPPPARGGFDLSAAGISNGHSVGPSIRPICTRCCFTMTGMIKVCSNFRCARVSVKNTRSGEILYEMYFNLKLSGNQIYYTA